MEQANRGKTIVVGVDGSTPSREALRWAAGEAKLHGASLHAVQAWELPTGVWAAPVGAMPIPAWSSEFSEGIKKDLVTTIEEALGESPDIDLRITVKEGNPVNVLIGAAEADDAELLVLGNRGRGGFTSLLLGSVSEQCVTHAKCPVTVVHSAKK